MTFCSLFTGRRLYIARFQYLFQFNSSPSNAVWQAAWPVAFNRKSSAWRITYSNLAYWRHFSRVMRPQTDSESQTLTTNDDKRACAKGIRYRPTLRLCVPRSVASLSKGLDLADILRRNLVETVVITGNLLVYQVMLRTTRVEFRANPARWPLL